MKIHLEIIFATTLIIITSHSIVFVSSCYTSPIKHDHKIGKEAAGNGEPYVKINNANFRRSLIVTANESEYHNYRLEKSLAIRDSELHVSLLEFKCDNDKDATILITSSDKTRKNITTWKCEEESNSNTKTNKLVTGLDIVIDRIGNWKQSTKAVLTVFVHNAEKKYDMRFLFIFGAFVAAHILSCICGAIYICYRKKHPRPPSTKTVKDIMIKVKINELKAANEIFHDMGTGDVIVSKTKIPLK